MQQNNPKVSMAASGKVELFNCLGRYPSALKTGTRAIR